MLAEFIKQHQLTENFAEIANHYYIPLADALFEKIKTNDKPFFLGINGCQGSGKSTLSDFLCRYLKEKYQLTIVNMSLDDFYLSRSARKQLAENIHPMLATRGVPGTHDIPLLQKTLKALKNGVVNMPISKFNKATDDLFPATEWPLTPAHVDLVLLEGWCWGVDAQAPEKLAQAINPLESENDRNQIWRQYVNQRILEDYQPLYSFMQAWLMLQAPSFDCVANWRWEQEEKLLRKQQKTKEQNAVMNKTEVMNFIQYFQRLTEECLKTLPNKCDWLFKLDYQRTITDMIIKEQL